MKKLLFLSILILTSLQVKAIFEGGGIAQMPQKGEGLTEATTNEPKPMKPEYGAQPYKAKLPVSIGQPKLVTLTTPGLIGQGGTESPLAQLVKTPLEIKVVKSPFAKIPVGDYKLQVEKLEKTFMLKGLHVLADLGDGYKLTLRETTSLPLTD